MKLSDACKQVMLSQSMHLVRVSKQQEAGGPINYDVKPWEGNKRGWTLLDVFTASAVSKVYDAVNDKNKDALDRLSLRSAVNVCFKMLK